MWLLVAVTSYFINAGVYVADKFLLSKKIHSSIVYAFFVGIWSIFNFVLLIFDPWLPSLRELSLDLLAGGLFLLTLIFWYKALHQSEATRVVPIVGALVPIFSFILSYIFLGQALTEQQLLAFIVLIIGGVLISVKHTRFYYLKEVSDHFKKIFGNVFGPIHAQYRPTRRLILNSLTSALLFAAYYVLIKYIYDTQPFIGSFVWSRLGTFIGVLLILFVPDWRRMIFEYQKGVKTPKNLGFFLGVRMLAAVAFIMLNWAISLGNVALINSIQGTQYIFLLLIVVIISHRFPKILEEELGGGVLMQKIIGTALVGLGLYMLIT
ncbi:EamA family transporter [Candidatus Parcubacteria bacterium]|nr:EamA family transporter [Candidatus Parcubacteria bacterium]